ncbi:MAG: DHH family phosphoesterase [Candidatus ainarchaeum sp.]|nr:DHH family phosphoesterase [Candidatus ainarchaeum sp.]
MKLFEGSEISIKGVITKHNGYRGNKQYVLTDGKDNFELISSFPLDVGTAVNVSGKVENHYGIMKIKLSSFETLDETEYSNIEQISKNSFLPLEKGFLVKDEHIEKLKEDFLSLAKKLYSIQKLGKGIIVRFHNDGDGICGALSLSSFLKAKYVQQNSAIYSVKDALRDINDLSNYYKSVIILVDFGSNEESKDGLSLINSAGIEIISIDHHPYSQEITPLLTSNLNPWKSIDPEIASKYTAGYLCSELSRLFGYENIKYPLISLCSDKSDLLKCNEEHINSGIVLNYAAAYSGHNSSLDFYLNILSNKHLFHSILMQANEKIEELISISKKQIKEKECGKFKLFYLNLGSLVKKFEFPGIGKSATQIFEYLIKSEQNFILVAYGPKTVVLRITPTAFENGADAREIISHIKNSMPDFIISGGGHSKASAIRIKEGFETSIFPELESFLSLK